MNDNARIPVVSFHTTPAAIANVGDYTVCNGEVVRIVQVVITEAVHADGTIWMHRIAVCANGGTRNHAHPKGERYRGCEISGPFPNGVSFEE